MIQISPFEVVIGEQEYIQGIGLEHAIVNILGLDGVGYRLQKLSGGRTNMYKLGDTGIKSGKSSLRESMSLLPENKKIPIQLLDDIILFFKKVMKLKGTYSSGHGDYEAMAHILWNKDTKEYRVAIPKQKVSKAAVSYDWSHKGENEEVILDIHSHNTMGAFFSGTDDSDDTTYFGISGVAGKLNDLTPALVWRVNFGTTKREIALADIFEVEAKVDNPEIDTWLTQVEVPTYTQPSLGLPRTGKVYGGYGNYNREGSQGAPLGESGKGISGRGNGLLEDEYYQFNQAGDASFLGTQDIELDDVDELADQALELLDDDGLCQLINRLAETVDHKTLDAYGINLLPE